MGCLKPGDLGWPKSGWVFQGPFLAFGRPYPRAAGSGAAHSNTNGASAACCDAAAALRISGKIW